MAHRMNRNYQTSSQTRLALGNINNRRRPVILISISEWAGDKYVCRPARPEGIRSSSNDLQQGAAPMICYCPA